MHEAVRKTLESYAFTVQVQERALERGEAKLRIAVETLEDIRDNYDCDKDAHKYGTPCRVCSAQESLTQIQNIGYE